ncbi:hypothetical protein, partial [Clostridioides difficile]|uniref:hypothetical protein n=1 Tax=Clostridioides difficile TaxID=1496 RepID=UPI00235A35B2
LYALKSFRVLSEGTLTPLLSMETCLLPRVYKAPRNLKDSSPYPLLKAILTTNPVLLEMGKVFLIAKTKYL